LLLVTSPSRLVKSSICVLKAFHVPRLSVTAFSAPSPDASGMPTSTNGQIDMPSVF
jgi:hypothetical protein